MKLGALWCLCFISIGCVGGDDEGFHGSSKVIDMSREPSEVLLPESLWHEIELSHIGLHTQSYERDRDLEGKSGIVQFYTNMPLEVRMSATHPEILTEEAFSLVYPDGGGTLDLARFTERTGRGGLTLHFDFPKEHAKNAKKVYFLSETPQREIDGRLMGAGCNVFLDLTSFFDRVMKTGGLELFLKEDRHLTVFGGTFFLVSSQGSQLFFAHLKITDSRSTAPSCP